MAGNGGECGARGRTKTSRGSANGGGQTAVILRTPFWGLMRVECDTDTAQHLLLHDEVGNVKADVSDRSAATARQQPGVATVRPQVERPSAGGLCTVLHAVEFRRRHKYQMRPRFDCCNNHLGALYAEQVAHVISLRHRRRPVGDRPRLDPLVSRHEVVAVDRYVVR